MENNLESNENSQPGVYERNLPDVTQMLKYAKIDKNNLTEVSQAIYFPKASRDTENIMLIELNPQIMEEIEKGQYLYFKG